MHSMSIAMLIFYSAFRFDAITKDLTLEKTNLVTLEKTNFSKVLLASQALDPVLSLTQYNRSAYYAAQP